MFLLPYQCPSCLCPPSRSIPCDLRFDRCHETRIWFCTCSACEICSASHLQLSSHYTSEMEREKGKGKKKAQIQPHRAAAQKNNKKHTKKTIKIINQNNASRLGHFFLFPAFDYFLIALPIRCSRLIVNTIHRWRGVCVSLRIRPDYTIIRDICQPLAHSTSLDCLWCILRNCLYERGGCGGREGFLCTVAGCKPTH